MTSADPLLSALPLTTLELPVGGRIWRITAVTNQDALLDIAERFDQIPYGLLLWESAIALAEHIAARRDDLSGRRVLELGCGVGLAGLVARSCDAGVHQTDHEPRALRLAAINAAQNAITGISQFQADWRQWDHATRYDLILGADIVYERAVHPLLARIFAANLAPSGEVWLTDPGRPNTLEFLSALEDAGWRGKIDVLKVPDITAPGTKPPVDVTLARLCRRG